MKAFLESFKLEFCAAVRSRALYLLLAFSVAWMFIWPKLMKSDGTSDGDYQLFTRYSLGVVFCVLVISLSTAAARSLPIERTKKRLSLTLVKPVRPTLIALGKIFALTTIGAIVLFASAICALVQTNPYRQSYYVLAPQIESAREEAERMYKVFLSDPSTPTEVKKTKKSVIIRLLTQKAIDHYQTIETNSTAQWYFDEIPSSASSLAVRLRFTNMFETRDNVNGIFVRGEDTAVVSNITQSVLKIPFEIKSSIPLNEPVEFKNNGKNSIMLRPRRDIHLLYGMSWSFYAVNLSLAIVELTCILAAIISLALFLGSALGQSVAVFTIITTIFLSTVSSTILEQYPDQLEKDSKDRIGLFFTRCVKSISSPIDSFHPISSLVEDEFITFSNVRHAILLNLIFLPFLLSLASGFVMPRKQDSNF